MPLSAIPRIEETMTENTKNADNSIWALTFFFPCKFVAFPQKSDAARVAKIVGFISVQNLHRLLRRADFKKWIDGVDLGH